MHPQLSAYQQQTRGLDAAGLVAWALDTFGPARTVLASSLGAEDQVLTAMLAAKNPAARVFTLDTGRLFQETHDAIQATLEKYGLTFEIVAPDAAEVAALVRDKGPNLFYESVELRRRCCAVRKVHPLRGVLATADAWLTGLRREQSVTRGEVEAVSYDAEHGLFKICPLFDWSEARVWAYIRANGVPYHRLHDQGFPSIGCAPCTRAVAPGEDVRAGRWWWESPEHKECGLHRGPGRRGR
jgi:phosphoadenosine phosphosulfate reductase